MLRVVIRSDLDGGNANDYGSPYKDGFFLRILSTVLNARTSELLGLSFGLKSNQSWNGQKCLKCSDFFSMP